MQPNPQLLDWLLDSDPALRWQVQRDLAGASRSSWQATRALVATEGFGARLLALQDPDGQWAGGAYFPGEHGQGSGEEPGQPWTATTWTLNTLREWGLDQAALAGTAEQLRVNSRWEYENLPYWQGEVDCCINGYTLANGAWLGADVSELAEWFIEHRLADGGWNCEWVNGSRRSSVHSTLNSLKGLLYYEAVTGDQSVRATRLVAQQYLLQRCLMRRLSTGQLIGPWVSRLSYPFRWSYSALNAADYFRAAALHDSTGADPRLADAIEAIRAAQQPDGRWLQDGRLPGQVWFEVDVPAGEPSKWLTFHCLRLLAWWDAASGG